MNKSELIQHMRTGRVGTTDVMGGWTCAQVVSLWEQHATPHDRRNFTMSVCTNGAALSITIARRVGPPAKPMSDGGKLLATASAFGVGVTIILALSYSLLPETVVQYEPVPTCWKWDRDNHTLSVNNTMGQFEVAHEVYLRTGKAPDRLTECNE